METSAGPSRSGPGGPAAAMTTARRNPVCPAVAATHTPTHTHTRTLTRTQQNRTGGLSSTRLFAAPTVVENRGQGSRHPPLTCPSPWQHPAGRNKQSSELVCPEAQVRPTRTSPPENRQAAAADSLAPPPPGWPRPFSQHKDRLQRWTREPGLVPRGLRMLLRVLRLAQACQNRASASASASGLNPSARLEPRTG